MIAAAAPTAAPRRERSAAIDMARGIAIILVVYGHCVRGLVDAGTIPAGSPLLIVDYVIYAFHMPLFFIASGLFFRASADRDPARFWRGRLMTLVYPYFLWSLIQGAVKILLGGSGAVNSPLGIDALLAIGWAPIAPFWFLYALFFANVLAYPLRRMDSRVTLAAASATFLASFFLAPALIADIGYGFLYFAVGIAARERGWLGRVPVRWAPSAALTAAFLAAALGSWTLGVPVRLAIYAALLGSAATLAFCNATERTAAPSPLTRGLAFLGQLSFSIYVMHILVLGLVRTLLLRLLHIDEVLVIVPVATLAAILVPLAIHTILLRYGLNDFAGLPASARPRPAR